MVMFPIVVGMFFGIGVAFFLGYAFIFRSKLLPEEHSQVHILTLFPYGIYCGGLRYSGPFSRITLYQDMLVIKVLGASTIFYPNDFDVPPSVKGAMVIFSTSRDGYQKIVKVATYDNTYLIEQINGWLNQKNDR